MPARVFEILFLCTGNRFRSVLAERLFRRATEGQPVAVSSRGTLELGGLPPLPEAEHEAQRFGIELSDHRTRSLRGADLAGVDLVVGFERMHVVAAVMDAKAPRERSFTLPELVGLLDAIVGPPASDVLDRARKMIASAHTARSDDPTLLGRLELADPIGGSADVFRETADRVSALTGRLAAQLFSRGTGRRAPLLSSAADFERGDQTEQNAES